MKVMYFLPIVLVIIFLLFVLTKNDLVDSATNRNNDITQLISNISYDNNIPKPTWSIVPDTQLKLYDVNAEIECRNAICHIRFRKCIRNTPQWRYIVIHEMAHAIRIHEAMDGSHDAEWRGVVKHLGGTFKNFDRNCR